MRVRLGKYLRRPSRMGGGEPDPSILELRLDTASLLDRVDEGGEELMGAAVRRLKERHFKDLLRGLEPGESSSQEEYVACLEDALDELKILYGDPKARPPQGVMKAPRR